MLESLSCTYFRYTSSQQPNLTGFLLFCIVTVPLQPNGTPTRIRRNLDIAGISNAPASCSANSKQSEIEARLQEIIKLTGIITINGQKYHSSIHDLEHQGELGFGSCGHVVKMRHPPSNAIIAVKVCFQHLLERLSHV